MAAADALSSPYSSQAERQGEKLRAQIARMVAGNGPGPNAVVLQSEQTTAVKLLGQLDVRLSAKTKTERGKGSQPGRWRKTYDSIADLNASLPALQTDSTRTIASLQYAADQIVLETNQGWGLHGSDLPISHLDFDVGAKEICAACRGDKLTPCQTCNGQRRHECQQCQGRKQTQCPTCFGRMALPSGEDCMECRKQGFVNCAQCQGQGEMACRACGGKGAAACAPCDGTGSLWQQITCHMFAQTTFKMSLGGEYEPDILQHIRRLRPEHLLDGRAAITIGEKILGDGVVQVEYQAEFPITQMKFAIGDAPAQFVMLGKKPLMIESTHFMDKILKPSLDVLQRARGRQMAAPDALAELAKIRFYRDALFPGKKLQDLRRHYPFGISANILRETPPALQYLLSILTEQPRMMAAIGFNILLAAVLFYFAKTSSGAKEFQFSDIVTIVVAMFLSMTAILSTHVVVTQRTLKTFGIRASMNGVAISTALGKNGFISIGVSFLLCLLALALR